MMHVLIARTGLYHYEAWHREHLDAGWSMLPSAKHINVVVEQVLDFMFRPNVTSDLTFTTRHVDDVDIIETPEQFATGVFGCEVEVYCREGRIEGKDDRWANIQRPHGRSEPFSFGVPDGVFRPQTLRSRITAWFDAQGWHTFGPPRPRDEKRAPHHGRELLVRHADGWQARLICPANFPVFKPGPIVSDLEAARRISKMPQNKSAVRRAKHQANDARFKAEAAERARQREAAT